MAESDQQVERLSAALDRLASEVVRQQVRTPWFIRIAFALGVGSGIVISKTLL